MTDLAGVDELLHGSGHVLDGHGPVDSVLVEQVDGLDPQPSKRCLGDVPDVVGAAVHTDVAPLGVDVEAELGGDDDIVANRRQCLADELLVDVGPVDLGGVEERDPALHGTAQHGDHLVAVTRGAVALAHPHATEADGGDLEPLPESALLHRRTS